MSGMNFSAHAGVSRRQVPIARRHKLAIAAGICYATPSLHSEAPSKAGPESAAAYAGVQPYAAVYG